jgi:hypothetical protein
VAWDGSDSSPNRAPWGSLRTAKRPPVPRSDRRFFPPPGSGVKRRAGALREARISRLDFDSVRTLALPRYELPESIAGPIERLRASESWPVARDAVIPALALRAVLMLFGSLTLIVFRPDTLSDGFLGIWNRWDGPHLLEVASTGYGPPTDPARIVLFPLYPFLIRIVSFALPALGAAMLISLLATVFAAGGLYRLVRLDGGDERLARLSVLAMLVFPTAYALVAPYTEAPFLALTIWAFVAIRRDDVMIAGLLGALAALTRIQGIFLLPALGLEYLLMRRRLDRDVLWILFVGVGFLAYLAVNYFTFGDPLRFLAVQESTFHVHSQAPWETVQGLVNGVIHHPYDESWLTIYAAPLATLALLAVVTIWAALSKHSRLSYALYAAISLVTFAALSWPISVPRYAMGVFPIFIALGSSYRSALGQAVAIASVLLLGVFATLFVMGHWAF